MKLQGISRNVDRSLGGVWWDYGRQDRVEKPEPGRFCLLIAERDNPKHRAAVAATVLDVQDDLRAGGDKAVAAAKVVQARSLAAAVVLDWSGAKKQDGSDLPYSQQACIDVLSEPANWPLLHFVMDMAGLPAVYRDQEEQRAAGN